LKNRLRRQWASSRRRHQWTTIPAWDIVKARNTPTALAGSRSAAAAIRVDTVLATAGVIRGVEEYQMVFSSARKF
jgi:hypothetical protein